MSFWGVVVVAAVVVFYIVLKVWLSFQKPMFFDIVFTAK